MTFDDCEKLMVAIEGFIEAVVLNEMIRFHNQEEDRLYVKAVKKALADTIMEVFHERD